MMGVGSGYEDGKNGRIEVGWLLVGCWLYLHFERGVWSLGWKNGAHGWDASLE